MTFRSARMAFLKCLLIRFPSINFQRNEMGHDGFNVKSR